MVRRAPSGPPAPQPSEPKDIAVLRTVLYAKLHRVTVTQADLDYVGSVTIDRALLEAARLLPGEQVSIVDVTNGNRLTTYVIEGEAGSGQICINGAAALLVQPGDIAIIIAYAQMDEIEARTFVPRVVFVDHDNHVVDVGGDPGVVPDGFGLAASGTPRGLL